ncbi:MAG: hypothetical protein J6039_03520 [Alphaproteobacteria bacterium]|nr:hypothetical protein [Alphaproteobacteria bacterium]
MKRVSQSGRSMIEMLGVLAIVGILTVGGFSLVTKVNTSNQVNTVIDEISSLALKVRVIARDYPGANGDMTEYVYNGRAYPDSLSYASTVFTGGSDVDYKVYYYHTNASLFIIQASNLNTEMCMEVLTSNWGSPSTNGFMGIKLGEAVSDSNTLEGIFNGRSSSAIDIGTATNNCGDDKTVQLIYR